MGMFSGMVRRSNTDQDKLENYAGIYSADIKNETLKEGDYNGCHWIIKTFGTYPCVGIQKELEMSGNSGRNSVMLKDHTGVEREVTRDIEGDKSSYYYFYDSPEDFILGKDGSTKQEGKKHSINSMERDCEAFIDGILDNEGTNLKQF